MGKIIHLCDNIFYNNYLEKGILENRENIQARIMAEVIQTFVDFFGKKHENRIIEKVAGTNLNFIYQTSGTVNSIAVFLAETKNARFFECSNFQISDAECFNYISRALNKKIDLLDLCQVAPELLGMCLNKLNISLIDLKRSKRVKNEVVRKIKAIGDAWNSVTYSDNPEINANLVLLEEFVKEVESNVLIAYKNLSDDAKKSIRFDMFKVMLDPIAMSLDPNVKAWDLFCDAQTCAFYGGEQNGIYFGIFPDDTTILHEFVHKLNGTAFERGYREKGTTPYTQSFGKHQMFNECITDLFSILMFMRRTNQMKEPIVHTRIEKSNYEVLIDTLTPFLSMYLPELKEISMREFPSEELIRLIGKDNFEEMMLLCNELVALDHDQILLKKTQENSQKKFFYFVLINSILFYIML